VVVIPQRPQGLPYISSGRKRRGAKPRLLPGVVIVVELSSEEEATRSAVTFWSRVIVVQMGRNLGNSEPAVLRLRRQFVEPANQKWSLIMGHDSGARNHSGVTAALVESPNGLHRDASVRCNPEVMVCPQALDEIDLWRIPVEVLEAVLSRPQHSIVLAASLVGAIDCGINCVVGALLRRKLKCRIRQRTRRHDWRNVKGIEEGWNERTASGLAAPGRAALRPGT